MIQILFAILAGILTIAAPCILPMLPILLGASIGQQGKQRPLLIVCGFIVSFAASSLVLSTAVSRLNLPPDILRDIAISLLVIFAILMIWPKPFELLMIKFSGTVNAAGKIGQSNGNFGALLLGLALGVVWTPCAGPVLGSILTLIATQGSNSKSATLVIAYALGAGIPMLIIAYGSQLVTTKVKAIAKYSVRIQQLFGALILLLALAMYFQYDVAIVNNLTGWFPQSNLEQKLVNNSINPSPSMTNEITFHNYGPAPDFTGISHWLNSDPLTVQQLKGKVVLVDFWTYSCINCIRTLPYVTKWYNQYHNQGLVVVGVHTPEFEFEKVTGNVQDAIQRFGIHYPVAQDNDYATWNAYSNQYWPAEYLIDKNGNIVYTHFGEGEYDHTENAIRELLGLNQPVGQENGQDLSHVNSPEMYFGLARLEYQDLTQMQIIRQTSTNVQDFILPDSLALNTFALEGKWKVDDQQAALVAAPGKIKLHFSSGKAFMVAAADHPITIKVTVDGKRQPDVTVTISQLYTLFDSTDYSDHTLEIDIPDAGFEAFTFTFG